jgi:hypothetical protein
MRTKLLLIGTIVSVGICEALAQAPPAMESMDIHLFIYRTEHSAMQHCPNDRIVWADTKTRRLYLPSDPHYGHTQGGFACEKEGRARGYQGPKMHA